jgi:hypothetical protein
MPAQNLSSRILSARYVAIRTAEGKGLTDRLLEAARDRTPGVRGMLVPMLYRFWHRNREQGWTLLERIGDDILPRRFPWLLNLYAMETFGEVSLAVLNNCVNDPPQLNRLAAIWHVQVVRTFATPLARVLGRNVIIRLLVKPTIEVLKRTPANQLINFRELRATFAQPDASRQFWRQALVCLEQPEVGIGPIADILTRKDCPFDLYLLVVCELALIYHGVSRDTLGVFALLERVFAKGCPWFRPGVLYVLFHVLTKLTHVEDDWLDRYAALVEEFFVVDNCRMTTSAGKYNFASYHLAWPEVVIDRRRSGTAPRILPRLMRQAIEAGDEARIEDLFSAIDMIAFAYGRAALALSLLERTLEIGGASIEERVLKSLATVRLRDQPLVDAFIEQHRNLTGLRQRVEGVEPTIRENDTQDLIDEFAIQQLLNSSHFRSGWCTSFRRAIEARSVSQYLVQVIGWVTDEFTHMTPSAPRRD